MANGLWQFVQTDGALYPQPQDTQYDLLLKYSQSPESAQGYFWNDYDKLMEQATRFYGVERAALLLYYYSDTNTIIRMIVSQEALDVMNQRQPWRYELSLYVDPNTGLISSASIIFKTQHLFQKCSPLSRLPKPPNLIDLP